MYINIYNSQIEAVNILSQKGDDGCLEFYYDRRAIENIKSSNYISEYINYACEYDKDLGKCDSFSENINLEIAENVLHAINTEIIGYDLIYNYNDATFVSNTIYYTLSQYIQNKDHFKCNYIIRKLITSNNNNIKLIMYILSNPIILDLLCNVFINYYSFSYIQPNFIIAISRNCYYLCFIF